MKVLQKGLKENLAENPAIKNNPQNTINELIVTLRIKDIIKNIIIVYTSQPFTFMQDDKIDILKLENILELKNILKLKKIYININNDIKIFKIIIKNNLLINLSILNQIKDIMTPP